MVGPGLPEHTAFVTRLVGALVMLIPVAVLADDIVETSQLPGCETSFVATRADYRFVEASEPVYAIPDNTRVAAIHFTRLPIFDETNPEENHRLFRWANRVHSLTRVEPIRQELLFQTGDKVDARILAESARLLRQATFLYDAAIRPVRLCNNQLELEVVSKDLWSLTPEFSFSRSGGSSAFQLGIRDSNLFGSGRQLGLSTASNQDRSAVQLDYEDKNIKGSRIGVRLATNKADDGERHLLALQQPFYSLDTRSAWAITLDSGSRHDSQYFRGETISKVQHSIDHLRLRYGFSKGLVNGVAQRIWLGYAHEQDNFQPLPDSAPLTPAPRDQTLSYPFVQYALIEDRFDTTFNLDNLHRTEDLHLGLAVNARLGYASPTLGADTSRLVYAADMSDTPLYKDKMLLQYQLALKGQWNLEHHRHEDLVLAYQMRFFQAQNHQRAFVAALSGVYSKGLNSNQQIVLGGDTGARAFRNRFQTGDRRLLLTFEERQYTNIHLLNLIRVGFAAFLDIGRAWTPGVDDGINQDWLVDVGLGLRLASSKAQSSKIIHIDFAFPLTNRDDEAVDSMQIGVTVKNRF